MADVPWREVAEFAEKKIAETLAALERGAVAPITDDRLRGRIEMAREFLSLANPKRAPAAPDKKGPPQYGVV